MPRSCCGPAMGPRLLYCMAFCLLGAGHTGARVIQSPRYQVTGIGKQVSLSCSQNLDHDAMYWYQQKPNQAPKLLLYYYDTNLYTEKDTSDNFKASRDNSSFCSLDILLAGFEDTAVYLCASSKDTELGCYLSPDHKPLFPRSKILRQTTLPPYSNGRMWVCGCRHLIST